MKARPGIPKDIFAALRRAETLVRVRRQTNDVIRRQRIRHQGLS